MQIRWPLTRVERSITGITDHTRPTFPGICNTEPAFPSLTSRTDGIQERKADHVRVDDAGGLE